MHDTDYTLTSPVSAAFHNGPPVLCVTVVWHPDTQRIGEQCIAAHDTLELSRYLPLFQRPGQEQTALGYGGISREPVRIVRDAAGDLEICPPSSRMVVELNGEEIRQPTRVTRAQIQAGAILGLGRAVLLCLHWMRCLPRDNPVPGLLGAGEAAIRMRELIRQIAPGNAAVLLLGETGTGKEVVARAIHALSARAAKPLVMVNMAALNESLAAADLFGAVRGAYTGAQQARGGLFAEAQQATLFLDEIGNAPANVQPMLLRVLETGDYRPLGASADLQASARIIAATDQDLYGGAFNQALLRRLECFVIHLPPLRARREDFGILLLHMLGSSQAARELPASIVSRLANDDWPGNIRQLKHVAQRCLLALQTGTALDVDSLLAKPAKPAAPETGRATAARRMNEAGVAPVSRTKPSQLTEEAVLAAMDSNGWMIQDAAQALGISRPSLYKLLEAHTQIRRIEQIARDELLQAYDGSGGDVKACAARLRTPSDALRRHLRMLGLPV